MRISYDTLNKLKDGICLAFSRIVGENLVSFYIVIKISLVGMMVQVQLYGEKE